MKIFSISTRHDSSYCVLNNGVVEVHNELERFTRVKHDWCPFRLWDLILKDENIKDSSIITMPVEFDDNGNMGGWNFLELKQEKYFVGHHSCHASNAYYSSPFSNAIIFTFDGGGYELIDGNAEMVSSCVFVGDKNKIHRVYANSDFMFNPGQYWMKMLVEVFSMGDIWSESGDQSGSLMSLASFGSPDKYRSLFYDYFYSNLKYNRDIYCNIRPDIQNQENIFHKQKIQELKKIAESGDQEKFNLASSLQESLENFITGFVLSHVNSSKSNNICFSGGVSLNCVALAKVSKILIKKGYNVFCDFAPNDSGLSIGAAKYYYYNILDKSYENKIQSPYLGRHYFSHEVMEQIEKFKDSIEVHECVNIEEVVNNLMAGKIISIFNGRSESGKRALGNRSILADPRLPYIKDFINEKVKHRQSYRPFAPSVLREFVSEWFEFDIDSPYMSFALPVKEEKKKFIPGVVHVDGTARLQTVTSELNGSYYDLIKLFYEKTGVPMVLNTSFNDREPIVETPYDAINCFLKTKIDYLYFVQEKVLIAKK